MSNYGIREYKRQEKKRKKKLIKKRIFQSLVAVFLIVSFVGFDRVSEDENLITENEDNRLALAGEVEKSKENDLKDNGYVTPATDRGFEDVEIPSNLKIENDEYSDKLLSYVKSYDKLDAYSKPDENSKSYIKVEKREYLKYYGTQDNYSKVKIDNKFYYVKSFSLGQIEDKNSFKVVNGVLFVDDTYYLPEDFDEKLDYTASQAATAMIQDMQRDGLSLSIASDKRSYELEQKLNESSQVDSDLPGHSEHQTGEAFDFYTSNDKYSDKFKDTDEYKWLKNNAYKYGFIERYPENKTNITNHKAMCWHFRFVGVENAIEIYQNDLSLEEYLKIK